MENTSLDSLKPEIDRIVSSFKTPSLLESAKSLFGEETQIIENEYLFEELKKTEKKGHLELCKNGMWNNYHFSATTVAVPFGLDILLIMFQDFLEDYKISSEGNLSEDFMCMLNLSKGFGFAVFQVKLFLSDDETNVEFRHLRGDDNLFFKVYTDFLKIFGKETFSRRMQAVPCNFSEKLSLTLEEKEAALTLEVDYMNKNPLRNIERVVKLAMDEDPEQQGLLLNSTYNCLLKMSNPITWYLQGKLLDYEVIDVNPMLCQLLGLADTVRSSKCKLPQSHKILLLGLLITKVRSCMEYSSDILESVKLRATDFVSSEPLAIPFSELISEQEEK